MLFALYAPAVMVLIVGAVRTGPDVGYPLRPLRACHHPAGGEMGGGFGGGLRLPENRYALIFQVACGVCRVSGSLPEAT